jgi:protoporphyrinogen oxidase
VGVRAATKRGVFAWRLHAVSVSGEHAWTAPRLWGVPATEITTEWCERFVPLPKLEDVLRGAVGANPPELGYNTQFWYPVQGIGRFSAALAARVTVDNGAAITRISLRERKVELRDDALKFDVLLSTLPMPTLVALLEEAPDVVRGAAARLRATHLYYYDVALRVPNPQPYHWVYVPESRYPFYRVGCYSHFSPALAPSGCASLYVELATRERGAAEAAWHEVVRGLIELGVLRSEADVAFARLRCIDPAYVIYDHAHRDAVATIVRYCESERIVSTGRYGGWNYSSMEDALRFGREGAARAMRLLQSSQ